MSPLSLSMKALGEICVRRISILGDIFMTNRGKTHGFSRGSCQVIFFDSKASLETWCDLIRDSKTNLV